MGTLWFGGTVRPLDTEEASFNAVFTEKGKIVATGSEEALRDEYRNRITREENLYGGTMYPGFTDSHLHMIGHGEKIQRLDLSEVTSVDKMMSLLKESASRLPDGKWLIADGFNENLFTPAAVPHRRELDRVTSEHPVVVSRVCRHAMLVNTYALELGGIDAAVPDPPGGKIEKDNNGVPTGYLHDQAQDYIRHVMPSIDGEYLEKALLTSLEDLWEKGFTGAHTEDLNYYGDHILTLKVFENVIDGEKRKFRANLLVHHEVARPLREAGYQTGQLNRTLELGAVKIFGDGALGGRTALLRDPYSDDPSTNGVSIHQREDLIKIVATARELVMPVAIHTIGDLALEYAVDALEAHPPPEGMRDRLIHLQVTAPDLLDRLQKLPVVLDIQPRFVASDFPWVEQRLGKDRLSHSFAWKTYMNMGIACAGGSDAPIEPPDPLLGIHAAVTRRKPGESHSGYLPDEKLTLFEALRLFTTGSASAIVKEQERGLIKEGYTADFTVFDRDLFELEPDEWLDCKVTMTVVDESIMYDKRS
ncbi:amidohydrolase [Alteribacter natronophilus]|uniref:amidohydrolase n=1 Tax=Alteribacter natronophilus TaxID=2583810 RepID=UPI00110DDE8B|nr:amidohydrolase [Alteribacter natronophilus]TMW71734.1 amidohydrolase [Alteribacter natronophilus]